LLSAFYLPAHRCGGSCTERKAVEVLVAGVAKNAPFCRSFLAWVYLTGAGGMQKVRLFQSVKLKS